ncbi:MAG: twin-arginine translocase subunit TatB [Rhodospirillales bacterium]|nr:twin-arginine translocase subunit TatB [Rhodospirillales bacterium]
MFDLGWQELFLIAVVALIVVGPKDLPAVLRTAARVLNKARAMSREFQAGLAEFAREAELDDIKRKMERAARFDPDEELKTAIDPTGKLREDFDPAEFNRKLKSAVEGGPPSGPSTVPPASPSRDISARDLPAGDQPDSASLGGKIAATSGDRGAPSNAADAPAVFAAGSTPASAPAPGDVSPLPDPPSRSEGQTG